MMVPQEKISYRKYQQLKVTEQNDTSIEILDIICHNDYSWKSNGNQLYIFFSILENII